MFFYVCVLYIIVFATFVRFRVSFTGNENSNKRLNGIAFSIVINLRGNTERIGMQETNRSLPRDKFEQDDEITPECSLAFPILGVFFDLVNEKKISLTHRLPES